MCSLLEVPLHVCNHIILAMEVSIPPVIVEKNCSDMGHGYRSVLGGPPVTSSFLQCMTGLKRKKPRYCGQLPHEPLSTGRRGSSLWLERLSIQHHVDLTSHHNTHNSHTLLHEALIQDYNTSHVGIVMTPVPDMIIIIILQLLHSLCAGVSLHAGQLSPLLSDGQLQRPPAVEHQCMA